MKKNIHPKYQKILFVDSSTGHKFVCGSTLQPEEKDVYQGKEYPVYHLSTSSASHPFFTGSRQLVDSEGRVDKFNKRYSTAQKKQDKEGDAKEEDKNIPQKDVKSTKTKKK